MIESGSAPGLAPDRAEGANCAEGGLDKRLAGYRLLAAEDCPITRLLLEGLLARHCARLEFVETGQDVLALIRQEGPDAFDLVLTDIQMPGMNGCEAALHLRVLAPHLPVVGLTGNDHPGDRAACLAAGMVDVIHKPLKLAELVAAIERHGRQP